MTTTSYVIFLLRRVIRERGFLSCYIEPMRAGKGSDTEFVSSPSPMSPDAMTEATFTRSWKTRAWAVSKGYSTENERVSTRDTDAAENLELIAEHGIAEFKVRP